MAAIKTADFLVEIGTEELPPKSLRKLMQAFASNLERGLADGRLEHGAIKPFASPRRIAAIVEDLALSQQSRKVEAKGPPVSVAFDTDGTAKPAALAFAKKSGVAVEDLGRSATDKGEWLTFCSTEKGVAAAELLPAIVEQALQALPIQRRMRWGASDLEFVRPVHWVILLHGKKIVRGSVMGRIAGNTTRGHRFLSAGEIKITGPASYAGILEKKGFVLADFDLRQQKIMSDVRGCAVDAGGTIAASDHLYEEVAALTEWPVAMIGRFDEEFLELPAEVITASLTGHQRYFPIVNERGDLLPSFVVVANLASADPGKVLSGNERVIRSRLADAAFFWRTDRETRLEDRSALLDRVVYQKGLGSLRDKSNRVTELCTAFADDIGVNPYSASHAAQLAKCDLLTGMVGEFPELQGIMGKHYARADGEMSDVANAIGEQYLPRFAGDAAPKSVAGQLLALADKLDTLAGVFVLGKKPTGKKDPFALRRAALGVIRILIECGLELDLRSAIELAVRLQPGDDAPRDAVVDALDDFIADRLRSFYVERPDVSAEMFDAVNNTRDRLNMPLPDFDQRIAAVRSFAAMEEAESLAAANKRISNILEQSSSDATTEIDESLFQDASEKRLYDALCDALTDIAPLQQSREYAAVLARLAALREPVDRFFDEVLVMADDERLKRNRLALLAGLREPFHSVADVSRLAVTQKGR